MRESEMLHTGDPCWVKQWGEEDGHIAEISTIETQTDPMSLTGTEVEKVWWRMARGRDTIVSLTNGHWAYGYQIWPVKMWQGVYE